MSGDKPVLVTGGAGFIGANLAHRLLLSGQSVRLFDNLSRPGVEANLRWLRKVHRERLETLVADVRDAQALQEAVRGAGAVFHLAAQVAVTTSLENPRHDFEVNLLGTINLLEALRTFGEVPLIFTSTNKVYGSLGGLRLREGATRYEPADSRLAIDEAYGLDFYSPYGCSKGAADQYVLDYARSFGLPAVVLRMSCIYGPRQFGTEDQGWVAHFLRRALEGEPITLYGDGKQVRDILFVEDLIDAFLLAQAQVEELAGEAFNIGGGPGNTTSLLELVGLIGNLRGEKPKVRLAEWRAGDQRYYVSDLRKFGEATGWAPEVGVQEGVERLHAWLLTSRELREKV